MRGRGTYEVGFILLIGEGARSDIFQQHLWKRRGFLCRMHSVAFCVELY